MNFIKKNYLEIIFYFLFCIGIITLSFFHEPRFDEFEAWGISKESIQNILFFIPHFECHLPLWFLILKCFSYFNINPEIGVKIPNLLFMIGAVYFLIFKSSFPKIVKLTLPFTFYIFYMYSIINRPYSIFCFAMFWLASLYKDKEKHPFLFALVIAILCQSCMYGIAIAAGITIVWCIEILKTRQHNIFEILKNKSFFAIIFIFLYGILLLLEIYPNNYSDKSFSALFYGASYVQYKNYILSFIYSLTGIFAEITFLNCFNLIIESIYLCETKEFFDIFNSAFILNSFKFLSICLIGLLIHIFIICKFKKYNVLLLYSIPFSLIVFLFTIHFAPHHIGLLLIFIIFVYWCGLDKYNLNHSSKTDVLTCIIISAFIIVQIFFTCQNIMYEVRYPTSPARQIANYIKEHNLDNYKIMGNWLNFKVYKNKKTNTIKFEAPGRLYADISGRYEEIHYKDFNQLILSVVITQYFNRNIFYNLNPDEQKRTYLLFKVSSDEENQKLKSLIQSKGTPDIIIEEADLKDIFDEHQLSNTNYILIKSFPSYSFNKYNLYSRVCNIYMDKDLYNKLKYKNKI